MKNIIKFILVPFAFLIFYIAASVLSYHKVSFTVLTYNKAKSDQIYVPKGALSKGKEIRGIFRAKDNNLGIVFLGFERFVKPNFNLEDKLLFQIRERGSRSWLAQNYYNSGQFENQLFFPFGFPLIQESKGKFYEFRLVSLNGNSKNSLTPKNNNDLFLTGYKYSLREILGSRELFETFAINKLVTLSSDFNFLLFSTIFIYPLLVYIVWLEKDNVIIWKIIPLFTMVFFILDLTLIQDLYFGIYVIIVSGWILTLIHYKFQKNISFFLASVIVLYWVFLMQLNINGYYPKENIWAYTLLIVGVLSELLNIKSLSDSKK